MDDNETWIIDAGDLMLRREARCGYPALSDAERAIFCFWFVDYAVRNAGTLAPLEELCPDAIAELQELSRRNGCMVLSALLKHAHDAAEFCQSYYRQFDGVCGELRALWGRDVERMRQHVWSLIEASGLGQEQHERLKAAVLPSVRLQLHPGADIPPGGSRLGGAPDLPANVAWPRNGEQPLAFVAQINLAEIAALPVATGLPSEGLLCFFYDVIHQPWGDAGEEGGWRVIYHPASPPATELGPLAPPSDLPREVRFPVRALSPEVDVTLPHPFSHLIEHEWGLLGEAYWQLYEQVHGDQVYHRMFGHPQNANSSMEHQRDRAVPGGSDWRLLLQIDSDEQTGMMWGDVGRFYFWIQAEDLKARRFERTWPVLQCS